MLEAGADLHAVQRIMRHKSPVTTMKTYGHVRQEYLRAQLAKLKVDERTASKGNAEVLATPLLLSIAAQRSASETPTADKKKPSANRGFTEPNAGGADGTRTRGLRRDRPAL